MMAKKTPSNPKTQKTGKKKKGSGILTIIIAAILTLFIGIYLLVKYGERIPSALIPTKQQTKTVYLYFSDEDGLELKAEKREINKNSLIKEITESIHSLIRGSKENNTKTIPEGTRLLGVDIKEGTAFINFSSDISERHPGGSSAELQTIYSIVNTITMNFNEIKNVQFLIEGKKERTLAGHIDISFPFDPDKK